VGPGVAAPQFVAGVVGKTAVITPGKPPGQSTRPKNPLSRRQTCRWGRQIGIELSKTAPEARAKGGKAIKELMRAAEPSLPQIGHSAAEIGRTAAEFARRSRAPALLFESRHRIYRDWHCSRGNSFSETSRSSRRPRIGAGVGIVARLAPCADVCPPQRAVPPALSPAQLRAGYSSIDTTPRYHEPYPWRVHHRRS
jgi:hypothetical protein